MFAYLVLDVFFFKFLGCNPCKFCVFVSTALICFVHMELPVWSQTKTLNFFGCYHCKFRVPRFPRGWFAWYRRKHDLITCLPVQSLTNFRNFLHVPHPIFVMPVFQVGDLWYIWKYDFITCLPVWSLTNFGIFLVVTHAIFHCPGGWFVWYI